MFSYRAERISLLALLTFGALSAIGGGVALVGGWITFPAEWLDGSLFDSYIVPGLILAIVVGGSQLIALIAVMRHHEFAPTVSGLAGCVMMGWIIGEVIIVGSESGLMRQLQVVYFLNGLLELALAALQLRGKVHAA